jgi:hypothetical protein
LSWIAPALAWAAAVVPVSIEALRTVRTGAVVLPLVVPTPDELDSGMIAAEG